jgi:hypothetical protein
MTSVAEVASYARNFSRDFGTFFETNFPTAGSTLRLPHPLVEGTSVTVINNEDGDEVTDFVINERQGLLKLANPAAHSDGVYVSGLYYQWFLDTDLEFFAQIIGTEHLHQRTGVTLESITGAEVEVMGIGAMVSALWSLLAEFATDIDVSTPEGMSIPAHQRYQQLQTMIQYWEKRYEEKAAMLNVGLKKMEMFTLRRISRLTNRYVPMYRGREIDNPRPPIRVRPPIDPIEPTPFEEEEAYWQEQGGEQVESFDYGFGGWNTMGTGGSP